MNCEDIVPKLFAVLGFSAMVFVLLGWLAYLEYKYRSNEHRGE